MKTSKDLYPTKTLHCVSELDYCPICGALLFLCDHINGRKTVQTLPNVLKLSYQPKKCPTQGCHYHCNPVRSAEWLQIAPIHGTYGYDVIASIGWERQNYKQTFGSIFDNISDKIQISESQIRYIYYEVYHPLLACNERKYEDKLRKISEQSGLIIALDGLAPEGGEPQLWLVRELQTGLTIRAGWLSRQDQTTFENFLHPIVDQGYSVSHIMSDKQRGLVPAVKVVFTDAKHSFCQAHYLKNIAEPVSSADESMKIDLRKAVREEVGGIIKEEAGEETGVMTVTGIIPSSIEKKSLKKKRQYLTHQKTNRKKLLRIY
jgi:hypothetical protein